MTNSASPARCSIPCNLCGARDVEEAATRDRDGAPLRTVICQRCGLLWTDPRPQTGQIHDYYALKYRLDYKSIYQPKAVHLYRSGRVALERWEQLKGILKPGSKVLDFGAGAGEFVYVLRAMGCDAAGIEPNEGYARFAAETLGMPVRRGFYQDAQVAPESCDTVTMFHVLEHLEDPFRAVSAVTDWLKPCGHLVIVVPNVEAVCQWPGHRFHRAHLYSFNPATLERLCTCAGFAVEKSFVSSDGGNVTVVAKKLETPGGPVSSEIAGNYDRIIAILRGHTALRHLLSGYPLRRPLKKLAGCFGEYLHTRGRGPSPEILAELLRGPQGVRAGRAAA